MLLEVRSAPSPGWPTSASAAPARSIPIRLRDQEESRQGAWTFRIRTEGRRVRSRIAKKSDGWLDLYAFTREPQYPGRLRARQSLHVNLSALAVRPEPDRSEGAPGVTVVPAESRADRVASEKTTQTIDGDLALLELLADRFGLQFPAGTRFEV